MLLYSRQLCVLCTVLCFHLRLQMFEHRSFMCIYFPFGLVRWLFAQPTVSVVHKYGFYWAIQNQELMVFRWIWKRSIEMVWTRTQRQTATSANDLSQNQYWNESTCLFFWSSARVAFGRRFIEWRVERLRPPESPMRPSTIELKCLTLRERLNGEKITCQALAYKRRVEEWDVF